MRSPTVVYCCGRRGIVASKLSSIQQKTNSYQSTYDIPAPKTIQFSIFLSDIILYELLLLRWHVTLNVTHVSCAPIKTGVFSTLHAIVNASHPLLIVPSALTHQTHGFQVVSCSRADHKNIFRRRAGLLDDPRRSASQLLWSAACSTCRRVLNLRRCHLNRGTGQKKLLLRTTCVPNTSQPPRSDCCRTTGNQLTSNSMRHALPRVGNGNGSSRSSPLFDPQAAS